MNEIFKNAIGAAIAIGVILAVVLLVTPTRNSSKVDNVVIGLQPFGEFEQALSDSIEAALKRTYGFDVVKLPTKPIYKKAFDSCKGGRYNASVLIQTLKREKPDSVDFILGLLSKDIFVDKKDPLTGKTKEPVSKYRCWGIFGLGYRPGPSCVISTARPKTYCKTSKQYIESMQKISIHEIGHNLGLNHCDHDTKCVMRDAAETIKTIHQVGFELCTKCRKLLQ